GPQRREPYGQPPFRVQKPDRTRRTLHATLGPLQHSLIGTEVGFELDARRLGPRSNQSRRVRLGLFAAKSHRNRAQYRGLPDPVISQEHVNRWIKGNLLVLEGSNIVEDDLLQTRGALFAGGRLVSGSYPVSQLAQCMQLI